MLQSNHEDKTPHPLDKAVEDLCPDHINGYELVGRARLLHHTPEDFDEGDIVERIERYSMYRLVSMPVEELDRHEWAVSEDMVDNYVAMTGDCPPIIVDPQHSIIDGTHRLNAAIGQGKTHIWAYLAQE